MHGEAALHDTAANARAGMPDAISHAFPVSLLEFVAVFGACSLAFRVVFYLAERASDDEVAAALPARARGARQPSSTTTRPTPQISSAAAGVQRWSAPSSRASSGATDLPKQGSRSFSESRDDSLRRGSPTLSKLKSRSFTQFTDDKVRQGSRPLSSLKSCSFTESTESLPPSPLHPFAPIRMSPTFFRQGGSKSATAGLTSRHSPLSPVSATSVGRTSSGSRYFAQIVRQRSGPAGS